MPPSPPFVKFEKGGYSETLRLRHSLGAQPNKTFPNSDSNRFVKITPPWKTALPSYVTFVDSWDGLSGETVSQCEILSKIRFYFPFCRGSKEILKALDYIGGPKSPSPFLEL